MGDNSLNFKISSALKNLIGKELITDQYVAIFELVKNSFDAHATEVTLKFENIYDADKRKIIIQDNGKGMNYNDLVNKWLFVAYSAKRDGTEDNNLSNDYRNKIKSKRIFAGAKGVGRFSCDRLGKKLNLITIKEEKNSKIENIQVDWETFEEDSLKEFIDIPVRYETLETINCKMNNGTILEITDLRDEWNREILLRLKRSLEKLINPSQTSQNENFSINIIVEDEIKNDSSKKFERDKINGYVKNTIFETLDIKTTQILSSISEDGEVITTTLRDRGTLIYSVKEKNPYKMLSNISINIFILNTIAKHNFTKLMGVEPVNYGSIFMYKNGFRIYPYGEVGEDIFDIDKRKTQGHYRFFGTRELIGRIEISGNEENLKETTSRDGGLIKNTSYNELKDFFYDKAIKRLEKYVYEVIKWGDPFKDKETDIEKPAINPDDVRGQILEIISSLSRSTELISIDYDKRFIEIINEKQEKSASKILKNLSKSADKINDSKLKREVEATKKYFNDLIATKKELEVENEKKVVELKKVEENLEQTIKQNIFLKTVTSTDIKDVLGLQHHINRSSDTIARQVNALINAINKDKPTQDLIRYIMKISFENEKILKASRVVTKANFDIKANEITDDLIQFIDQYLENVYSEYKDLKINNEFVNVHITNKIKEEFIMEFRPLEITMLLDNLLHNSAKAKAKNVYVKWELVNDKKIRLYMLDDGNGISDDKVHKIFDFGFTTTDGSGIGLYHVKDIVENKMKGKILVNNKIDKGVEFIVEVRK